MRLTAIRKAATVALGWAFFALAPVCHAASFDPDLTWRTLTTPHFNITFHGGEEQLAEEMAKLAEEIWVEMTEELQTFPKRRTEVVLVDHTDSANGYAMTLPVNTIVIFVTAPGEGSTLSNYEDWNDAILTHEFTHILHIDTVEGIPKLLRSVFGRIVTVNRVSPGWIVEGQATFQETRHTPGGRGRSTIADMVKRVTVLEGPFPPLGNLDGWQRELPAGNLRYLFGQDFQQYISDETGEMVWTDFIHKYGAGIPYLLPGKRSFGERIPTLYRGWKESMIARYEAQAAAIKAEGVTPFQSLSDEDDACASPTYSPDSTKIVWACNDPSSGAAVFIANADGSEAEVEIEDQYAGDFTWRNDSAAFVFSSMHVVNRFNLYSDVYLHELGEAGKVTLTNGKRARDPSFSPDGKELLVVTNGQQNNQLSRLVVDRQMVALTEHEDHTQLSAPRFSPDGKTIALTVRRAGKADIWMYDTDGKPLRRLMADSAVQMDPEWSRDGKTLFFSSDRTGVFNIHAVDLDTEQLYQVTNVLGGAFHPSVDMNQTSMVFENYTIHGAEIALMSLDRSQWKAVGQLPQDLVQDMPLRKFIPLSMDPIVAPDEPSDETQDTATPDAEKPTSPKAAPSRKPEPKGSDLNPSIMDDLPLHGMTGLGGAWHLLAQQPGRWGLPGEGYAGRQSLDQPVKAPDADNPTATDEEAPEEEEFPFTHPVGRYNPIPSLLPPRFVAPGLYQTSYGLMGVLSTAGTDTLRNYLYSGFVSYRTDSRYTGWGASLALNKWLTVVSGGAYSYTVPYGELYNTNVPDAGGGTWIPSIYESGERYWDRRTRGYLQVSYPLSTYRSVFARWAGTHRQPLEPIDDSVYRPLLPTRGFLSSVGGGWRYAKGKSYANSISAEDARLLSFVGEVFHPLLGSYILDDNDQPEEFTQLQVTAEWREYMTNPWVPNHVLAFKLAGGAAFGDEKRYGSFRLGGSFGESGYYTLPDEWRALRGFPPATVYGDWFYLNSTEYRFPIAYIDRGFGLIPFFARSISGAVYVDTGNAFSASDEGIPLSSTLVGTGAEIRATAIVGWGFSLRTRVGYGFAVHGEDGYALGDSGGWYAWLGTSF